MFAQREAAASALRRSQDVAAQRGVAAWDEQAMIELQGLFEELEKEVPAAIERLKLAGYPEKNTIKLDVFKSLTTHHRFMRRSYQEVSTQEFITWFTGDVDDNHLRLCPSLNGFVAFLPVYTEDGELAHNENGQQITCAQLVTLPRIKSWTQHTTPGHRTKAARDVRRLIEVLQALGT
ncbi:MAG: hypothetical protein V4611_03775 [Patescibacteria group bacterium]